MSKDEEFMKMALDEAQKASQIGEVPVGALIINDLGELVGQGFNQKEVGEDPTLHAEMLALRQAAKNLGRWRLNDCTMYVTLEPCPMCAGALVQARVQRLVIGTLDSKGGGVLSKYTIGSDEKLNHQIDITSGVLEQECSLILKDFFRQIRANKNSQS